jgi:hypothetical protein
VVAAVEEEQKEKKLTTSIPFSQSRKDISLYLTKKPQK